MFLSLYSIFMKFIFIGPGFYFLHADDLSTISDRFEMFENALILSRYDFSFLVGFFFSLDNDNETSFR